jgi:hypothetical protein
VKSIFRSIAGKQHAQRDLQFNLTDRGYRRGRRQDGGTIATIIAAECERVHTSECLVCMACARWESQSPLLRQSLRLDDIAEVCASINSAVGENVALGQAEPGARMGEQRAVGIAALGVVVISRGHEVADRAAELVPASLLAPR